MNYADKSKLIAAKIFGAVKHKDQLDDEGKDYFMTHCYQVFNILMNITDDIDILRAGLLHDTLEDTNTTYEELEEKFNTRVADLVLEVTHEGTNDQHGYYFPRLKSRDAILIKFADRLSNLSRMEAWAPKRQQQYIKKSIFWRTQ